MDEWERVVEDKDLYVCDITHYQKVVDRFKEGILILRKAFNIDKETIS